MQLIKTSTIYLGSSILNKSIPFLLLPILTKFLSPEEYGILSIFQLMITFYSAFIGMSIHTNISKNFHNYSKQKLAVLMGNILLILCCSTIIFLIPTYIISLSHDQIYSIPSNWLPIIPIISFMLMLNIINLTVLRNEEKALTFGSYEIVNTLINAGVTIVLLIAYNYGWQSRAIGIIVAYFIFFITSIIYLKKNDYLSLKIDYSEIKQILKISLPLIPHVIGGIIISLSDRLFIEHMVGLKMVGIYSTGYMFGMFVRIFTDAFINAWSPWFYKMLSSPTEEKKKKIVRYTYLYIVAIFIIAFFISLFSKWIIPLFIDDRYAGANQFVFWIAIGYAIHGIYKIFFPYLVHINKTSFLGFSTFLTAILNLLLNYILIKYHGAIGAAYATAISFTLSTILVFWFQLKNYNMPWGFITKKTNYS